MNGENASGEPVAMPLEQLPPQLWMAFSMHCSSMAAVCTLKQLLVSAMHVSAQLSPSLTARYTFLVSPRMVHP